MNLFKLFTRTALIATAGIAASASFAQGIVVDVDGVPAAFNDAQPQMIHGMVYVPIRGVFEQMGATIEWDAVQRRVIGRRGDHTIVMRAEGASAMVDNRAVNFGGRARIIDGSEMVPLRFVSEALGARVEWDGPTQTVNILTESGHFISDGLRPVKHGGG